jgi:hypothetical protein
LQGSRVFHHRNGQIDQWQREVISRMKADYVSGLLFASLDATIDTTLDESDYRLPLPVAEGWPALAEGWPVQ